MKFKKKVRFLGMQAHVLKDGSQYFSISLFDTDSGSVDVNVQSSHPCVSTMSQAKFGDELDVTFVLREKDKLYKLGIA